MTSLPASLIVHTEARDESKHITGMNTVWVALEREEKGAESRKKEYGTALLHLFTSSCRPSPQTLSLRKLVSKFPRNNSRGIYLCRQPSQSCRLT